MNERGAWPGTLIFTKEDVLSAEQCSEIIELFKKDPGKYSGQTSEGYEPGDKTSTDLRIGPIVPGWGEIDKLICGKIGELVKDLAPYLPPYVLNSQIGVGDTGYQIQHYQPGQEFKWHSDTDSRATSVRMWAVIIYLNEVEEGGTTDFKYQNVKVTPKTGRLLVFPAGLTHVHRGAPVEKGEKFIVTTFLTWPN